MNFDESTISVGHQQSQFDQFYVEKVLCLLGILELIFTNPRLRDSILQFVYGENQFLFCVAEMWHFLFEKARIGKNRKKKKKKTEN